MVGVGVAEGPGWTYSAINRSSEMGGWVKDHVKDEGTKRAIHRDGSRSLTLGKACESTLTHQAGYRVERGRLVKRMDYIIGWIIGTRIELIFQSTVVHKRRSMQTSPVINIEVIRWQTMHFEIQDKTKNSKKKCWV